MVQVINDPNRNPLANALSTGLSNLIQGLAQNKAQKMAQMQRSQGLQALGIPDAEKIAQLDPKILEMVVKQKLEEPNQMAYANALSSLLGGEQQPTMPAQQVAVEKQQSFPTLRGRELTPKLRSQLQEYLQSPKAKKNFKPEEIQQFSQYLSSLEQQKPLVAESSQIPQATNVAGLNQKQATEIAKLGIKLKESARKEKIEAFKLSKDERKSILEAGKSARQNLHDLNRMEELEKEGKLDTPGYVEFLKRSGLDIPALMNPGSEEFNKIAQTFLRDAKTYLGSRISNFELEQFLKTVPNLSQSPEGRKRVIANLKRFNRISLEYSNALKTIIKENNVVPPLDLI